MKSLISLSLILLGLLAASCRRNINSPDLSGNIGTRQTSVPWPGLANSPWPMYSHDPQHTSRSSFRGPQQGVVVWLFNAGNSVYSSPAIGEGGSIYFGDMSFYAHSISSSGTPVWAFLGGGSDASPLIGSDGSIYFYGNGNPLSHGLFSYDESGHLNWQFTFNKFEGLSSPSISIDGGTIYCLADSVFALQRNGQLRWKTALPDSDLAHYALAVSPDGSTLFVPGYKGIYALDTSGAARWKYSLPVTPSDPAIDNQGNVYFAMGSDLYSLSASGGTRWIHAGLDLTGGDTGPAIGGDGTIYITGAALYAIDNNGALKWAYNLPPMTYSQCIPAIDLNGTVFFGRNTARTVADSINFLAINPDGTLKFQMCLRSPDGTVPDIDSHPSISSDGSIYVGSDRPHGYHVYRIE